jgi:hypothetical protein
LGTDLLEKELAVALEDLEGAMTASKLTGMVLPVRKSCSLENIRKTG